MRDRVCPHCKAVGGGMRVMSVNRKKDRLGMICHNCGEVSPVSAYQAEAMPKGILKQLMDTDVGARG